jgi:hypothetical protein
MNSQVFRVSLKDLLVLSNGLFVFGAELVNLCQFRFMFICLWLFLCQLSVKNDCIFPIFGAFVLFSKLSTDLFVLLIKNIKFSEDSNGLVIVFKLLCASQHRLGQILII